LLLREKKVVRWQDSISPASATLIENLLVSATTMPSLGSALVT